MPSLAYAPLETCEPHSLPPSESTAPIPLPCAVTPSDAQNHPIDLDPSNKSSWRDGWFNQRAKQPSWVGSILDLLKALLLPMIAAVYLIFCYVVHYRVVPVYAYGMVEILPQNVGEQCYTLR